MMQLFASYDDFNDYLCTLLAFLIYFFSRVLVVLKGLMVNPVSPASPVTLVLQAILHTQDQMD